MKIGFIGIGNMASAIIEGIATKEDVIISARTLESTLDKAKKLGVHAASSHRECVAASDIIILGVKPETMREILEEISDVCKGKTLVSIAAKLNLETLQTYANTKQIVRAMPNLNVAIQQGTTALVYPNTIPANHKAQVDTIFKGIGDTVEIQEHQMSGFVGLAGSLPAFVFKFIDAIAKECVSEGFTHEAAIKIASSAVSGSAAYLSHSGIDPQVLTDRVCSPGGTTIEGVRYLDALDFENIVASSIRKVIEKDKKGI